MNQANTEIIKPVPINISSKVKATERYKKLLQVMSLFMTNPLTPVEISIIDEFYHFDSGNINTKSRKEVRDNLKMSAEQLNNYIRVLRKKNIMTEDSLNTMFLQPIPEGDSVFIILKMDVVI